MVQAIIGAWRRFLWTPADPRPMAIFRIGTALVALTQVWVLWPSIPQLYGPRGLVQWIILESAEETWLPSIGKVALLLERLGVDFDTTVHATFIAYAVALAFLLVGAWTRTAAIAAWALHALTVNSGYVSLYGVDTMLHICLFYLVWMPAGWAWSVDAHRRGWPPSPSAAAGIAQRTLQVHLCIIYANTGIAKAVGEQWWTGEAIWRALAQPQFAVFDMSWLAAAPWIAALACWSVIVIEVGYPILIWPRRTRKLWLAATIMLHLGIAVMMGLVLFSAMMIVMNVAAFGWGHRTPSTTPRVMTDG